MIKKLHKRINYPTYACILIFIILVLIPTGFEGAVNYTETERCSALVMSTDESFIVDTGLIRSGEQNCTVEFLSGLFKGRTADAVNILSGSLENDKLFSAGDKALVMIHYSGDMIISVSMVDHWRIDLELILAIGFIFFLVAFAGRAGLRAVLSFAITVLAVWKLLVPAFLNKGNPILIGLLFTGVLTTIIIILVYGLDFRALSAIGGSLAGVTVTSVFSVIFTDAFKIHGAVMSYSESLLYSGYGDLNLTNIFVASIFIGAAGAMVDLSVDITSAVYEVVSKKPDISRIEAISSGMNVGRAAMGTITTTLLLAYSGGYITMIMVFMAQGTPIINILNYKYIASEIINTIVGSIGLVSVAPLTALFAGLLLTRKL